MLTQEQIKNRVNFIGASDAAAVLGMSRWKTRLQVWAEKTGLIVPEDISEKLHVKLGNKLEQTVAELFMEETGKKVHRVNETAFHPKYPFLGANLDRRVVGEKAVLEAKTCSAWKAKEWDGEEFPPEYVIQVMHQLPVTGADVGYLAVLIGNQDFKVKTVERKEKALTDLVNRLAEFWQKFVIPKIPPAVTSQDADTLQALYPDATHVEAIELGDTASAIAESLEGMETDYKALYNQIEKQKNELKAMLKDSKIGISGPWKFKWSNVKASTYTVNKAAYRRFTYDRTEEEKSNG